MAYLAAANVLNGLAAMLQYLSFAKKPVEPNKKVAKDKLVRSLNGN